MKTTYTLAPSRTITYTYSQRQMKTSVLAPYSNRIEQEYDYSLSEEELEVIRVGLFVDILRYEFMQHKGFSSSDWRALFKYWKKHIWQAAHWSASKELRKVNVRKMIKEGVLTVNTQKRLYGNEAWYPNFIEHEREQTIDWLKQLEPDDVEYTLCYYFEGGMEKVRDSINYRKHKGEQCKVKEEFKREPVVIDDPEVLAVVEEMFKRMKGFKSKDPEVLSQFAVTVRENPTLEFEIKKQLTLKKGKKKNPLASEALPNTDERVRSLKLKFATYEYEDFLMAFKKRPVRSHSLAPSSHLLAPQTAHAAAGASNPLAPASHPAFNPLAPEGQSIGSSYHQLASESQSLAYQATESVPQGYTSAYQSSYNPQFQEKPSLRPQSAASGKLQGAKPASPARKIEFVKLTSRCFRAVADPGNYQKFPASFESIQPLIGHIKSLTFYLSQFYEDQESGSLELFIQFCLDLHFPLFDQATFPARSLRPGEKYKLSEALGKMNRLEQLPASDRKAFESRKSVAILSENEVRMLVNLFTSPKVCFMKLNIIFFEFHEYECRSGLEIYNFWDRVTSKDRSKLGLWLFDKFPNEENLSVSRFRMLSEDRVKILQSYYDTLASTVKAEKEKVEKEKKLAADKLKSKYANPKRKDLYECKQTRWALGKKLLEIEKKFPLDPVVKNMVKVEFTVNPLKKYDLEYEAHNEEEELKRKLGKVSIESMKVPSGQKLSQEETLKLHSNKLRILESNAARTAEQIKEERIREQEPQMFRSLNTLVKKYLEYRKSGEGTVATYLSTCYQSLKTQFPLAVSKHFPFKNYGSVRKQRDGRMTFDTSYPTEFKHHFFACFRALLKTPKGLMILKSLPSLIWAPSSRSRCTIHVDTCPPDCMYVTLNKKLIRQKLKTEQYTVAWHSKLRPFFRPDMQPEKEKIFMTYADARECRFEPVTGSKVPNKHMALALKQFSEIRNRINPDDAPNMNMWVNKLGVNMRSAEPGLFKQGIYKQARALYIQTKYKESQDLLNENFNIPCILNYFEPGKNRPDINEKPQEDFNKPANLQLNTDVYQLYCAIKLQFRQARTQLKTVQSLSLRDPHKTVTKFMCPDPACTKLSCEFAHKVSDLRFQQENLIRTNYKKKLQEKIKNFQPMKKVPWVPAGSLVDCVNCHVTFLYKPKEKTQAPNPSIGKKKVRVLRDPEIVMWSRSKCCNKCSLEQRMKDKQKNFMEKSKEMNQAILQKSGRNQHDVTGDHDTKQRELLISEKIGQYRKARTLYKQRKFVEAYEVMKKVIEMIRRERSDDSKKVEDRLNIIKSTIGLETIPQINLNENDEAPKADDKKLMLFQTQAQRLKQGSSNDFLNYQIETFFLEVEKKLVDENNYASNLRVKAGNLEELIEGQDEQMSNTHSFLFKPKRVKVCESILKGKKCKKGAACEFAHFANQLDLVPTTKVIQNFYHTSEILDEKLKNDILPPDWKPWRDANNLPIYTALPLPNDLTKEKDLEKKFPFDT